MPEPFAEICAADECLEPRWKDGWCHGHWYAHKARLHAEGAAEANPESLAICEAIWNAS